MKKYGSRWKKRLDPRGCYNCAGHVWASRRTGILEDTEWEKIRKEDCYRIISELEEPRVGDLAVYKSDSFGYLHIGQIVCLLPGVSNSSPSVPRILSKWDPSSGEYEHLPKETPFHENFPDYQLRYWTDR